MVITIGSDSEVPEPYEHLSSKSVRYVPLVAIDAVTRDAAIDSSSQFIDLPNNILLFSTKAFCIHWLAW